MDRDHHAPPPPISAVPVLDAMEQRVLGALMEKEVTVPAACPLTLNSLRTACNQTTSRNPVTDYDDNTLVDVTLRLQSRQLLRLVRAESGGRAVRYRQRLVERLAVPDAQRAVLTVLLLRGAQAPGEITVRTERLYPFADRSEVEALLAEMAAAQPPLVEVLDRVPGQHDRRWVHLLGPVETESSATEALAGRAVGDGARSRERAPSPVDVPSLTDDVVTLRAHRADDLPRIVEQGQDPESAAWTRTPQPYAEADARAFLEVIAQGWMTPEGNRYWAVTDATDAYLGTVDLRPSSERRASLGFGLHPDARGRGVMSRAVRLASRWAFDQDIDVVRWEASVGNWASRRVAWACGFTMAGTMAGTVPGLPGSNGRDAWVATLRRGDPLQPTTRWYDAPLLEADDVRLRPWRDEDVADLADPDDASRRFMPAGAAPFVDDFQVWKLARDERMAAGEGIYWCVADAGNDRPLGHLQLFRLDLASYAGSGEVGYWLLPTARGRAVMATALDLLRGFSFRAAADGGLGLHRLAAGTDVDNQASNLVLRRAGFRLVGTEHSVMARPGEPHGDGYLWELLRDWPDTSAPVIESADVRLRPWRLDDIAAVVDACTDPRTRLWLGALPDPYGPREAEDFILGALAATAAGATVHWAVADPSTDEVIGSVTLMDISTTDGSAELGYWVHPGARGRGVVRAAGWLAARHAVVSREDGGLGLRRVTLLAATANTASRFAAERIGFVRVGTERAAQRLGDGSVTSAERYDLLEADLSTDLPTATATRSSS